MSVEQFSGLLDALYAASLDPEQWQAFLDRLCHATDARLGVFLCADSRLGVLCRAQGGSSRLRAEEILAYNQRYAQSDPFRAPCFGDPRPRIATCEELLPDNALLRSELYRDLLAPNDCRYATLAVLTVNIRRIEAITLWRSAAQGPMPAEQKRLLELLFPHIQRALEMRQRLGVAMQHAAAAETIADASRTPTFLLTHRGELVHANAAGSALVAEADAFTTANGELMPTAKTMRPAFRSLLRKASSRPRLEDALAPRALAIPRASGAPLQVVADPLPPELAARAGADVLVLASDPEARVEFRDAVLEELYRLTPAEAEIANGLLMGLTLGEIASLRQVSVGTVRGQLKSILGKTGAKRQSELVGLLMSVPAGRN